MKFIADFHIHSKYARATSKRSTIPELFKAALVKGITLLGTGDFTHPGWFAEINEYLEEDGFGFLKMKKKYASELRKELPSILSDREMRFILSVEISDIYKKNDKTRKNHNLIMYPALKSAAEFNKKLKMIGNIHSDGRPILGLDAKKLLELSLSVDDKVIFIPAHIWTPWFSLFGSKSGFDAIEECFEEMTSYIFALETGLSSDPPMNWRLSSLDRFNLVSNSDAHSPENLAREANIFNSELSYNAIYNALKSKNSDGFLGTIEFYPEEGKYHYDGHRNCGIRLTPEEAIENNLICPVCGKKLTIGVLHRVVELADRPSSEVLPNHKKFESLIPLREIISDAVNVGKQSKRVAQLYSHLLNGIGNELFILKEASIADLSKESNSLIAEGIRRVRLGEVRVEPGYDGEYGKVHIFSAQERSAADRNLWLNDMIISESAAPENKTQVKEFAADYAPPRAVEALKPVYQPDGLNDEQKTVLISKAKVKIIIAGPGTGKTFTLIESIKKVHRDMPAQKMIVLTFTNKAADEILLRLPKDINLTAGTFHSICLNYIKENGFSGDIVSDFDALSILKMLGIADARHILDKIMRLKTNLVSAEDIKDVELRNAYYSYEKFLTQNNAVDYAGIIIEALKIVDKIRFDFIFIDEFQDLNRSEYSLVKEIIKTAAGTFVIGDPFQSIYRFRGSLRDIFGMITNDFRDSQVFYLNKNYRNSYYIGEFAKIIVGRTEDFVYMNKSEVSRKVEPVTLPTEASSGIWVSKKINELIGGLDMNLQSSGGKNYSLNEIAVLARMRSLFKPLEATLAIEGIPYEISGGDIFSANSKIRFLLDILDVIQFGDSPVKSKMILSSISSKKTDFFDGINIWNKDLGAVIKRYYKKADIKPAHLVRDISFLLDDEDLAEAFEDYSSRYDTLYDLLLNIKTGREHDFVYGTGMNPEKVKLLTFHSAKGLEFPVVFIIDAVEKIVPMEIMPADVEEEARLFYVAATRSAEKLFIVNPGKLRIYGKTINTTVSPYLREMPSDFVDIVSIRYKKNSTSNQLNLW